MMTLLVVLIAIGPLLSGLAAVYGEWNRRHIQRLRKDVNGQSATLVATAHKLGVSEGAIQAQADAFQRGDTRGEP
jgi:hypothetical protein